MSQSAMPIRTFKTLTQPARPIQRLYATKSHPANKAPFLPGPNDAPFRVGLKEVYLPDFSVTLHRGSNQGPKFATFTVPLWFSKIDLRDYLFHGYNVRTLSIRSYIQQQKITQGGPMFIKGTYERPQPHRWHRPQSIKRMTVELETPFVWPENPKSLDPWQPKYFEGMNRQQDELDAMNGASADTRVNMNERASMRRQAAALVKGKTGWKPHETKSTGPVLATVIERFDKKILKRRGRI